MKMLQKICFVLVLIIFLSSCSSMTKVDSGDCFKDWDIDDCRVKAEQGNDQAQYVLGKMYYKGQGVPQDYQESVKWYRKSSEQGNSRSQLNLGMLYETGKGVPQDYKEAVKWYKKSAEQGHSSAQYNLGLMYYIGQGVLQDYVMSHMYWNIASVSGHKNAIKNRDVIEKKMTTSELEKAQDLAREWMRNHQ